MDYVFRRCLLFVIFLFLSFSLSLSISPSHPSIYRPSKMREREEKLLEEKKRADQKGIKRRHGHVNRGSLGGECVQTWAVREWVVASVHGGSGGGGRGGGRGGRGGRGYR